MPRIRVWQIGGPVSGSLRRGSDFGVRQSTARFGLRPCGDNDFRSIGSECGQRHYRSAALSVAEQPTVLLRGGSEFGGSVCGDRIVAQVGVRRIGARAMSLRCLLRLLFTPTVHAVSSPHLFTPSLRAVASHSPSSHLPVYCTGSPRHASLHAVSPRRCCPHRLFTIHAGAFHRLCAQSLHTTSPHCLLAPSLCTYFQSLSPCFVLPLRCLFTPSLSHRLFAPSLCAPCLSRRFFLPSLPAIRSRHFFIPSPHTLSSHAILQAHATSSRRLFPQSIAASLHFFTPSLRTISSQAIS